MSRGLHRRAAAGAVVALLTLGAGRGTDRFLITADDAVRAIVMMPCPELEIGDCVAALGVLEALKGSKQGGALRFGWTADPAAIEYHLNAVRSKEGLVPPTPHRVPAGIGEPRCDAPSSATECDDPTALSDAEDLYYQVLSACGAGGDVEGPL